MKDLNGKEINFADEKLFPPKFMMPKRNRLDTDTAKIHIEYEDKTDDEIAEDLAECMHSMDAVFK